MALKIKTNVSSKSDKASSNDNPGVKNTENNASYSIRQISNGWLVSKSWNDKDGKYHSEEVYHDKKPINESVLTGDSDKY